MIEANVLKNQITLTEKEQITSGSVNVYYVHFHFSSHWDNLEKVAVFRTPITTINVPIEDDICVIPWEVASISGLTIRMGVYGLKASEVILPTIWTSLGIVVEGVFIGDAEAGDHTPDIYDAILKRMDNLSQEVSEFRTDLKAIEETIPSEEDFYRIIEDYLTDNPPSIDSEKIKSVIREYLRDNPIKTLTEEEIKAIIKNYIAENPIQTLTEEDVKTIIEKYLSENSVGITEARVQEMIDQSIGAAISDGY